jgi:flavin reductase (DIM6/NTAB) family NADH-FMN oxidoreductase RutF
MAQVPTAVAVITAVGPDGPTGMTAVSVDSLSLDPPLMMVCVDRGARTLAAMQQTGRFGINLLNLDQEDLARRFASKDSPAAKFEGIDWTDRNGLPSLDGAMLWFACELRDLHSGGDHLIATGDIIDIAASPGEPLLFHDGKFRGLG